MLSLYTYSDTLSKFCGPFVAVRSFHGWVISFPRLSKTKRRLSDRRRRRRQRRRVNSFHHFSLWGIHLYDVHTIFAFFSHLKNYTTSLPFVCSLDTPTFLECERHIWKPPSPHLSPSDGSALRSIYALLDERGGVI